MFFPLRPNVLIACDDEKTPFPEDAWTGRIRFAMDDEVGNLEKVLKNFFFRFGENAVLRYNRPTVRCPETTIDPETGTFHEEKEPLRTLRKHRLVDPEAGPEEARRRKVIGEAPR